MNEYRRGSVDTVTSSVSDTLSAVSSADCEVTKRLLDLMNKTEYNLVQENGQRRLTAPELTLEHREHIKGAEVFLGRLPRDCYEDELMPILEKPGRLLELRLMLDFSGTTRGYAFALYADSKTARRACMMLDGYEIRKNHPIGAVKSVDNCRLFFGGVPKNKSKEEFMEELSKLMEGIVDVYLYPNAQDRSLNRGFIFVEFKDHRSAAMARRKLIPGRVLLWDHEVAVDWADPEPGEPVDEEIMENVTALFVRNLTLDTSPQKVRDVFLKATDIPILKLKKINHFAFIHYESRELAERVMQIMTSPGSVAESKQWEIKWAKPIGPIKQAERQRCINEAIKQSTNQKFKKSARKPFTKGLQDKTEYKEEFLDLQYVNVLSTFVTQVFEATCSFECMASSNPDGFFYKIFIIRNNLLISEDIGPLQPTKQLALNIAVSIVYQKLKNLYDFNIYQSTYPPSSPVINSPSQMVQLNVGNSENKVQYDKHQIF